MFTTDMPRMLRKKMGSKTVGMHVEQRTRHRAEPGYLTLQHSYIASAAVEKTPVWGAAKEG